MKRLGIFFGSAWCALGLIIGTMMFLDANKNDWDLVTIIVMLLIWELIGIPFLCFPVAKMISDKKTDKNGIECFGYIDSVEAFVGDESTAKMRVYISTENRVLKIEEDVNGKTAEYAAGDFIRVKYYNDDVNVLSRVEDEGEIPEDIRNVLKPKCSADLVGQTQMENINTNDWTLTEEAFSSPEGFEQNIAGEYELINSDKNIDESDIKEQNKKQLKRFVNVIAIFAAVMVIIIVVFLING